MTYIIFLCLKVLIEMGCSNSIENLKGTDLILYIRRNCKKYKNTENQYKLNETMNLIRYLNYDDINKKCCKEFQNSNFMLLFDENYKDFIEKLFLNIKLNTLKKDFQKESIQNIKYMNIILNLFQRNNQYFMDKIACEEFEKLFDNSIILFSSINIDELDTFFINSMNFLNTNSSEKINDIIESITNSFLINDFLPFYLDILKKNTINYDVQEIIVHILLDKSINNNKLELLLEEIFEQNLSMIHINLFAENLVNKITLNNDDFYKEDNSFSILLFYKINIVKCDIITIFRNLFEPIYNIIEQLYNDIMKKQIHFNELEKLYHLILNKLYYERMYLLCKGEINLMNIFEKTIYEDYEKYFQLKKKYSSKINEVLIFLNFYFKDSLSQKIKEYTEKLNHIEEFYLIDLDYSNDKELIEDFKIAQKYNELLNSLSFLGILEYHKLKKNNKEIILNYEILDIVYQDFQTLIHFILGNFFSINHLIPSILKKINSKDKLINEMILLKRYFKKEIDTSEIEEKIMFYINKKIYQKILYYLIQLIDDFKINEMHLYNDINSIYIELQEENNSFCDIIQLYDNLNDIYLKLFNSKISSQNLINLYKFCSNEENINNKKNIDNESNLVIFLINLTVQEIEQLNEFLEDDEINFQDIDDLELCNNFIKTLKFNINNNFSDEDLIKDFIQLSEEEEKVSMAIENIGNKFFKIKEKFDSNFDIKQSQNGQLKLLYENSIYNIKHDIPNYICEVTYGDSKKIEFNKTFDEIIELKDWALLRIKKQNSENTKIYEDLPLNIKIIENIINSINVISAKGYPNIFNYIIKINNGIGIELNTLKNIAVLEKELKDIEEYQEKSLKNSYIQKPYLRLVEGRNFNKIYNNINNIQLLNNVNKYLTNNLNIIDNKESNKIIKNSERLINDNIKKEYFDLESMYEKINNYIEDLYISKNINLEDVYNNVIIKSSIQGIHSIFFHENEIDIGVITIFKEYCNVLPRVQNILYCNFEITKEEIISFLYRAFLCDFNGLFIIINPENLSKENSILLIDIIKNELNNIKINSCLIFSYCHENDDVIFQIKQLDNHQHLQRIKIEENFKFSKNDNINIDVYTSEQTGLGKSTLIKNNFLNENYNYLYFPLGGDIKKNEIIHRLNKINLLNNKKIGFHLDLYDTNQVGIIREFLFHFLITKCYYISNEEIFYYDNELKITIEIPDKLLTNFLDLYPILNLFNIKEISKLSNNINNNINNKIEKIPKPKLIHNNNITSNFQICFNFLKYYSEDKINTNDIYIKDISLNRPNSNIIDANIISLNECEKLLSKYLIIDMPNYYQINSFISILGEEFKILANSIFLSGEEINIKLQDNSRKDLLGIRNFFIKCLIEVTKHFIKGAYDEILKEQNYIEKKQNSESVNINNDENLRNLISTKKVSFDKIDPSLIIFNDDKQSITIIATCDRNTEYYSKLKALYNSQSLIDKGLKECINYSTLKAEEYYLELQKVLNLYRDINYEIEYNNKILQPIKEIVSNYVFTSDNFIKLILIITRIRANIPVIMMGETGCGKTSLIKIIYDLKEKYVGSELEEGMLIFNFHSGIVDNDIINWMYKYNLIYNNNDNEINTNNKQKWVFFDEINTCNSMGLLSEILCKHTMLGIPIKKNIIFIAACNPYRLYTKKKEIIGLYDETKHKSRNLVYTVNPLPSCLLNFVFDFGSIKEKDERKYIENIISQTFNTFIEDKNIRKEMKSIATNLIFAAHNFIRKDNDESAVSLREVNRFNILFIFFLKLLENRIYENKYLGAINLSIYLCYYLRIFNKESRKEFCKIMNNTFQTDNFDFESLPHEIQNEIAEELIIENGYAKNRALLENLFALFVCIINKIPLFIVGKPGCSKSLSTQLIFQSMKGINSSQNLFKQYPRIISFYYQGSLSSTSEGIKKMFDKVRKTLKSKSLNEIIPVFYFDEMGLAEISKNNPLKAIHSELEYDEDKGKISFIGISNWSLDASKMNRGLFISIPEPDKDDLILTSEKIAQSYNDILIGKYQKYYESLAKSYYDYKNSFDKNNLKLNNFHGLRDFYHLIKLFSRKLIERNYPIDEYNIKSIIDTAIGRNFGGMNDSIIKFSEFFYNYEPNIKSIKYHCSIVRNIFNNLNDFQSRFLMTISKDSISKLLIESILKKYKKKYKIIIGSTFEDDIQKEFYSIKKLNEIQSYLYEDTILILKNLQSIYPSLYDLFNQNFKQFGDKRYTRIALGHSNSMYQPVHKEFRCIILVDPDEIEKEDPPFLNRFEKQIISFDNLLHSNLIEDVKKINNYINDMIENKKEYEKINIDLKSQLFHFDINEISSILYSVNNTDQYEEIFSSFLNNENEDEETINNSSCFYINEEGDINKINVELDLFSNEKIINEKITNIMSQDILVYMSLNDFDNKYHRFEIIKNYYKKKNRQNIKKYLNNIYNNLHIIYTFSHILEPLFQDNEEYLNEKFGKFTKESSKRIIISHYKSERRIEEEIVDFFNNKNYNLCYLQFENDNFKHLNHIKYLIENQYNEFKQENKVILFIVHLKRIFINSKKDNQINSQYFISQTSNFDQIFIDNLHGKNILITDIINKNIDDLFKIKELININYEFDSSLYQIFILVNFQFLDHLNEENYENYYIEKWINSLKSKKNIINKMILKNIKKNKKSILSYIFQNNIIKENDVDLLSIISNYLKTIFKENQFKIILKLFQIGYFSPLINYNNNNINNEFQINDIFNELIERLNIENFVYSSSLKGNDMIILDNLSLPGSLEIFKNMKEYIKSLKNLYYENDDNFLNGNILFDIYIQNKNDLEELMKREIKKYNLIQVLESKSEILNDKLFSLLLNDYFELFLKFENKENNNNIFNDHLSLTPCILEFLNLIIKKIESISKNNFQKLLKCLLWFECYSNYIFPCIQIISNLSSINNNFIKQFKEKMKLFNKAEDIITPENNNNIYNQINEIFYLIYQSLIEMIFENSNYLNNLDDTQFYKYTLNLENFANILLLSKNKLKIHLKSFYILISFIKIKEALEKNGKKKEIIKYMSLLKNEFFSLKKNSIKVNNSLEKEFIFLKTNISNDQNYINLVIEILLNKLKISKDNNKFNQKILELILSDNSILIKSKIILHFLLKDCYYDIIPNNNNLKTFPSIEYNNKKKNLINILNKSQNCFLDELLIQLFESLISSYFLNIPNQKILEQLNQFFQNSVLYIENQNFLINNNNKVSMLYCIVLIKYFCNIFTKCIINENSFSFQKLNKFLLNKNNNFRIVIKLYILKIIYFSLGNYDKMKELIYSNSNLKFMNEINLNEKLKYDISFLFFNIDNLLIYKKFSIQLRRDNKYNFLNINQNIIELIKKYGFDEFYNVIINEIISKLKSIQYNINFTNYFKPLIQELTDITRNILNLFLNESNFTNLIYPQIKKLSSEDYEIILHSHKISYICSTLKNKNSFYYNLQSPKIKQTIDNSYIPGGEPPDDLIILNSKEIENLCKNDIDRGLYICSCGYFYQIEDCTRPNQESTCPECGQKIGGNSHILISRPGHQRIYKDQFQKNRFPNIPGIILSDFIKLVEKKKSNEFKGIHKVTREFMIMKNKEIRGLNQVSYRLLSFIFYSNLYFAEKLNYLSNVKDYLLRMKNGQNDNSINCFKILKIEYKLLKDELSNKGINQIQIYLNMIYPKLKELIQNINEINSIEKRRNFENEINNLVEISFLNYQKYYINYIKENKNIQELIQESNKSIITEKVDYFLMSEEKYPLLKYFTFSNYPTREQFENNFDEIINKNNFPVINSFIKFYNEGEEEKIQNLPLINPFSLYMINRHSYNLTRKEANNKSINDDLIKIPNNKIMKMFENFKKGYDKLLSLIKSSDLICHANRQNNGIRKKNILLTDEIAYCLNDLGEEKGMILATFYHELIKIQNNFLNSIQQFIHGGELKYICQNINKEIFIQNAIPSEIIDLKNIHSDIFNSFEELISIYSIRNCFNIEMNDINYNNYSRIEYDFEKINIEMGKILLLNKKKFISGEAKKEQLFVTYRFETFSGNNSSIIMDFINQFPQNKLSINQKNNINELIEKINPQTIMFSIQMIIFYLFNNKNKNIYNKNTQINEIFIHLPSYIIIQKDMKILFNQTNNFCIKHLIDIFEFMEEKNYNFIIENVNYDYKINLNPEINENMIKDYFKNKNELLIKKNILESAIRKFISRFLTGTSKQEEFKNDDNLFYYLEYKEEIWPFTIFNHENFGTEIENLRKKFNVLLNQIVTFYELLTSLS